MVKITLATINEVLIIQEIAYKTWPVTYGEILSVEQIDYMLKSWYETDVLLKNMADGQLFLLATEGDSCHGFAVYEHHYSKGNKTRIHKIYILPEGQGKGIGKLFLDYITKTAQEETTTCLNLNVNKFNKAVLFYKKMGFEIVDEFDTEIGNGYLMEDYMMEKKIVL